MKKERRHEEEGQSRRDGGALREAEGGDMNRLTWTLRATLAAAALGGFSMNALAFLGFGGTSWKEEVLLHDGSKIVVERWATRGGRHEIGQKPPIKEQTLTFSLPATSERVTWKSEHSQDIGLADFKPILLDFVQGVAYVVASPVGCLPYNKWGRPNPPYVIFKHHGKEWRQIALQELPSQIKVPNLIISSPDSEMERTGKSLATADEIKKTNSELTQPEYRSILREPLPEKRVKQMCEVMVHYKCGWFGTRPDGTFNKEFADRMCNK